MESFFARYRNPVILGGVLLLQLLGLAVQVRRPRDPQHPDAGSVRLIRVWVLAGITPIEEGFSAAGQGLRQAWHDYVNVIGLRRDNQVLRAENARLQLEEIKMSEEAVEAHRLQALLDFKEHFPTRTLAAQVIGSSGTEQSRVLYIDKGTRDGLQPDMAVITSQGVVGKVRDVLRGTAQVLLINDPMSGVGALLQKSRLFGVVKGTASGTLMLDHIMSDEKVEKDESVITSGGDRIFPKGLPVGTVTDVSPGNDLFLNIRVRPAADLSQLEEVLVVTDTNAVQEESAATPLSAADILAQRLPTIEPKPAEAATGDGNPAGGVAAKPAQNGAAKNTTAAPRALDASAKPVKKLPVPASQVQKKVSPNSQSEPGKPRQDAAPRSPQSSPTPPPNVPKTPQESQPQ